MGKATELVEKLNRKPLTPAEIRARREAADIRDENTVATLDGTFEKRTPAQAPRIVQRAPQQTWD